MYIGDRYIGNKYIGNRYIGDRYISIPLESGWRPPHPNTHRPPECAIAFRHFFNNKKRLNKGAEWELAM